MPQLRDFLDRFRPAGAPGSAGRAAVPADRHGALAEELLPLLTLLDGTEAECARLVAEARSQADEIVAAARDTAAANLRDAGRRASAVRTEIRQQLVVAGQADAAAAVASARQEARELGEQARQRIPALASRAVDLVRALDSAASEPAGRWPDRDGPGWSA